jgi:hypothetical protein
MAYTRTTWQNTPSTSTPLNATNLNNIEQGILNIESSGTATQGSVTNLSGSVNTLAGTVTNLSGSVSALSGSVAAGGQQTVGTAITSSASSGTVYSVGTADNNKVLLCYGTAGVSGTIQLPLNATQPFSIGQKVDVIQMGSGTVTVTIASGGTLNYTPSNVLRTRFSAASMFKVNTNEWVLMGDLS